jgi:hypothetical protein
VGRLKTSEMEEGEEGSFKIYLTEITILMRKENIWNKKLTTSYNTFPRTR